MAGSGGWDAGTAAPPGFANAATAPLGPLAGMRAKSAGSLSTEVGVRSKVPRAAVPWNQRPPAST